MCLGFLVFRCEEALPRDGLPRIGDVGELGRWVIAQKGVTRFTEGLYRREGKGVDGFFFGHYHFQMECDAHWECTLE